MNSFRSVRRLDCLMGTCSAEMRVYGLDFEMVYRLG